MKQLLNIFVLLLLANIAMAQAPQGIPYQAVARNSSGAILASTSISVRFTIRDSIATGAIKYRETFSVTTTAQGMFSVNIGQGTPVTGTFSGINWGTNAKFMQVELDPAGGSSYVDMGTTQMMSVPYSQFSNSTKPSVSTIGDTVYFGGGNFIIFPGVSAANCFVNAGIILGDDSLNVGETTALTDSVLGGIWTSSNESIATVDSLGVCTGIREGTTFINYTITVPCGSLTISHALLISPIMPTISTTSVDAVVSCAARSGGYIGFDGGGTITARGVVWSTSPGPTIALTTKTTDGTGTGTFTSSITGLTASTTYYVRAYATNSAGTSYGTEYTFTTLSGSWCIGATYGGGKIAYILQPGDPGYVVGETHGLIAAPSDQGTAQWGCYGTSIGGTSIVLGTGAANTAAIVSYCTTTTIAARLCADLVLGGYNDWYLPSHNELQKLYDNRLTIGGFNTSSGNYWSSSQNEALTALTVCFHCALYGGTSNPYKSDTYYVRAVRSF